MIKQSNENTRPPIVTILGHVDHGKTSVLDKIRSSNLQAKESGGITQNIGAYQVAHQGKKITFIDTPGHEAFEAMRSRGGQIADIAILVVAADDGVKPQTKESIKHIKKSKVPYLVAINKIDVSGASVEKVKKDLGELGEYLEGFGGNVPFVEVSAKTGEGLDKLLELILLLTELEELKDTSKKPLGRAVVLESQQHPHMGPIITLLIKEGKFKLKDPLFLDTVLVGKIRAMSLGTGESLKEALPSTPIQVIGVKKAPSTGDIITNKPSDLAQIKQKTKTKLKLDLEKPNLVIKAAVQGGQEAVLDKVKDKINLVASSIGPVTGKDIEIASVNDAQIIGFNSKISSSVKKLATTEGVSFKNFSIIYHLFEYVDELIKQKKSPPPPKETSQVKIKKVFNIDDKVVLGGIVIKGKLSLGDKINGSSIISLQSGKEDLKTVKKDQEFGLVLKPSLDIKEEEVIITHSSITKDQD
jgi:translation initiation factor IF-2